MSDIKKDQKEIMKKAKYDKIVSQQPTEIMQRIYMKDHPYS